MKSTNMDSSVPSLVSPNVYQVHTNVTPQMDLPVKDKYSSAESTINCKIISSESKDNGCRETLSSTSQRVELNSRGPLNGLVSAPTSRIDSNTIMIGGEHMESCVVVDLQGHHVMVKENPSVQAQSAPYFINEQVLVQVSNEEQTVQAQPSGSTGNVPEGIKANQDSISLNINAKDASYVPESRNSSKEHSNSSNCVHLKPGVIFESRFLFHEVSGNDYPNISLPQGPPQKENLEVKLEKEEAAMQMPKRKSARKARLSWKNLEEDDNVIRKINFLKKRKHYPLSPNDKGKTTNNTLIKPSLVDLPVWARYLTSVRILDNKWIFGIASSKAILHQTLEGHSRSILCDYIKSHPSNFERRRNARSQECRLMWQHKWIIFDGVPFTMVSSDDLKCTFGMNYKLKRKNNNKEQKLVVEGDFVSEDNNAKIAEVHENIVKEKTKEASKVTTTPKKMYKDIIFTSCPAKITVKVIIKYPGYAVPSFSLPKERKVMLKALRADLSRKLDVEKEELYYVTLPLDSMHNHPFLGRSRNIHPSIIAKVKGLVRDGITTPKAIKRLLDIHVQMEHGQDMVTPHPDDRAYYPKVKDIGNLVYNYCKKMGIPSKRKNIIGQAVETSSRKKKRHKRTLSEGDNEGECSDNGITHNLPLQASTLQEAVRTFCTDEPDRGSIGVGEPDCASGNTVTQNTSVEVASLADMVRGQLDSLRNLTYSLNEVGSLQDMYQSLEVLLNQYANINHQNVQGSLGSTTTPTAAAFIIHESVVDPLDVGEAAMEATTVTESGQTSLTVSERDANGMAMTSKFRSTQVIENPHIRQFRPPVALQCLTTNMVPTLTMSHLPRSSNQTSEQGPAHLVTSLPSHSAANAATVSITQPTYQTLAPASHDASAVPVQLSLPPYFYYVQEVTVPETSSTNSTVNAR